jgi:hypothetical protein
VAVAVRAGFAARGEALGDEGQDRMNLSRPVHGQPRFHSAIGHQDPLQVRADPATWSRRCVVVRADGQDVAQQGQPGR